MVLFPVEKNCAPFLWYMGQQHLKGEGSKRKTIGPQAHFRAPIQYVSHVRYSANVYRTLCNIRMTYFEYSLSEP